MASIRYLENRKRWQVRWHITSPKTRKVKKGSRLLPPGCNRHDAEKVAEKFRVIATAVKYGQYDLCDRAIEDLKTIWGEIVDRQL